MIAPDDLLIAYANGYFPMAESAQDPEIFWVDPPVRGVLPILDLHISRSLLKTVHAEKFTVRVDTAFAAVIEGCAARPQTWINPVIRDLFIQLHERGYAHSVECWRGDTLAGGVYGLALGGAFFGESMFSRVRDASKVALVHLCARLWTGGFTLLDAQFMTDHLRRLGGYEIPRAHYLNRLETALLQPGDFHLRGRQGGEQALIADYLEKRKKITKTESESDVFC